MKLYFPFVFSVSLLRLHLCVLVAHTLCYVTIKPPLSKVTEKFNDIYLSHKLYEVSSLRGKHQRVLGNVRKIFLQCKEHSRVLNKEERAE